MTGCAAVELAVTSLALKARRAWTKNGEESLGVFLQLSAPDASR